MKKIRLFEWRETSIHLARLYEILCVPLKEFDKTSTSAQNLNRHVWRRIEANEISERMPPEWTSYDKNRRSYEFSNSARHTRKHTFYRNNATILKILGIFYAYLAFGPNIWNLGNDATELQLNFQANPASGLGDMNFPRRKTLHSALFLTAKPQVICQFEDLP